MTSSVRLTVRPLGPEDAAFAARTASATQPDHPWHEDELLTFWRNSRRICDVRHLAIEDGGRPAGWFAVDLRHEDPERVGRVLLYFPEAGATELDEAWALAEDAAAELGALMVRSPVWEDQSPVLDVLRR